MTSNYVALITANLAALYGRDLDERAGAMGADLREGEFRLRAFGTDCVLNRRAILLNGRPETGPRGIIVSLYALHAAAEACIPQPFKSFKQLPGSMPYAGAFANRTEQSLVPAVERIYTARSAIMAQLSGTAAPPESSGDFAFVVQPLPKIALCYLFYRSDEEFPAAVTCLYSHNAEHFMPTDGLADVGEYTSKTILVLAEGQAQAR